MVIGNDVWIGLDATIMPGVTIGDGAIIGAKSVVTHDVEPYTVVAGNPARVVKKRFDDETMKRLLKIQWWNWPIQTIEDHLDAITGNDITTLERLGESH